MNTSENTQNPRPFGYWIKATDRLMAAAFAEAFEVEGATRRDWRLLNVIDGTATAERPLHPGKVRGLVERGWVERTADGWALTDDGRAAKERLGALVDNIRATVTDAAGPDDLATTVATLEKIARAFGWDEQTPLPRRRGHRFGYGRHGFGRRHGRPFGRGFGPGFRAGFGPDLHRGFGPDFGPDFGPGAENRHGHPHGYGFTPEHGDHDEHPGHRHGHPGARRHGGADHRAQCAYERGFDAGFTRGRDA